MKKKIALTALILGIIIPSCKKEHIQTAKYEHLSFSVSTDDCTKTQLGENRETLWSENDCLSVFSCEAITAVNHKFEMKSEPSGERAEFSGEIEEGTLNIISLYPYDESNSIEDGKLIARIPTEQNATPSSFADGSALMFYKGQKSNEFAFTNLCAVISFELPVGLDFVKSVKVTPADENKYIAGNVEIDTEEASIISADQHTVTLSGSFSGGNTYYLSVVPGVYDGGLRFEVTTEKGVNYYRSNTKKMEFSAGKLYKIGKLSLVNAAMLTPAVTLAHTFNANGILTGTKVEASVAVPDEFARLLSEGLLSEISWSAQLLNDSEDVVRTVEGTGLDDAEMTVQNGFVYLPAGDYTLRLTNFEYTACEQELQVAGVDSKTATVTATAPAANTLKFKTSSVTGYTSYDVYDKTPANTSGVSGAAAANALDGSTIYNFSATLDETSGISPAIKEQMGVPSFQPAINGVAKAEGDVENIDTGAAELGCLVSFDGQKYFTTDNTTAPVSGLPFNKSKAKPVVGTNVQDLNAQWSGRGADNSNANYLKISSPGTGTSWALSPAFYFPKDVSAFLYTHEYRDNGAYWSLGIGDPYLKISQRSSDGTSEKVIWRERVKGNTDKDFTNSPFTLSLTPSQNHIFIENEYSASGTGIYIYYVTVLYK